MSGEILRRAAALMRERAHGATSGPWSTGGEIGRKAIYSEFIATRYATSDPIVAVVSSPQEGDTDEAEWGQTTDAEHIASWPPEVADWVAELLMRAAEDHDETPCPVMDAALTVARAYLGEQP